MHSAHASTGIEPIPHQCLTVLANRQAVYQTALPAWYIFLIAKLPETVFMVIILMLLIFTTIAKLVASIQVSALSTR
jgi:hypothetical protein